MLIESMRLKNFRQFKGDQKLTFSMDADKNVTIILGENGAGKTTLEQAFVWCLYGTHRFKKAELVNREARDELREGDKVPVFVELIVKNANRVFKIRRTQFIWRKGSRFSSEKPYFEAREQQKNGDWHILGESERYYIIKSMLPESLAGFFFFDGERIESMSEELLEKRHSQNFKAAVQGLMGLDDIKNAIYNFGPDTRKTTVLGKLRSELIDTGNGEIENLKEDLVTFGQKVERAELRKQKAKEQSETFGKQIFELRQEKAEMSDEIGRKKRYDELSGKRSAAEERQRDSEKKYLKYFSGKANHIFLQPLLEKALETIQKAGKLDTGVPDLQAKTVEFLLKKGTCICGTELSSEPDKKKHLEELILSLPPYSIGNMIAAFSREVRRECNSFAETEQILKDYLQSARDAALEVASCENEIKLIEGSLGNPEKVKQLNQRLERAEQCKKEQDAIYTQATIAAAQAQEGQNRTRARLDERIANDRKNRKNREYIRYAQAIYDELRTSYGKKESEVRTKFEQAVNRIFRSLYGADSTVHISENYAVDVQVDMADSIYDGTDLEQNTAQSYATIFAFIAGLIDLAKKNRKAKLDEADDIDISGYPLVMDAPLSSFDTVRIKKICQTLPQIADQVIIFIKDTDGTVAERELRSKIGSEWELRTESQVVSRIKER